MAARGAGATPKRHHYVPQWHLRRFAADSRRPGVWRYSKSADAYQYMAVRNAAVITHYYSRPGENGPDTSLEEALATLDGQGADIVSKLENGDMLDAEEALVLAAYTTMLHGRVPPARGGQEKVLETGQRALTQLRSARFGMSFELAHGRAWQLMQMTTPS